MVSGLQSRQRLAWLLRSNRLLGPVAEFRSARRFADAFREDDRPALAPSQVTRWETGQTSVNAAVVRRYEHLLGLPADSLATVGEAVAMFLDGPVDDTGRDHQLGPRALHELLERARTSGAMTGHDWWCLTVLVSSHPELVLHPPELWRSITDTLLDELVRAEHGSWYTRQGAMVRLLAHPASTQHAVEACIDMADDRNNPVFIEPVSLLDAARHEKANRYVLEQLSAPFNDPSLQGALLAATAKLRRGHYAAQDRVAVGRAVRDLHQKYERHPAIRPLVDTLHRTLTSARVQGPPPETNAWVTRIAAETEAQLETATACTDPVLAELIREALFDDNADARLYAAALLSVTPYRRPLAETLINALAKKVSTRADLLVERVLRLLTRLRATHHQRWVGRLLTDGSASAHVRHAAIWAASHSVNRRDELDWQAVLRHQMNLFALRPSPLDQDMIRGLVYNIGAEAHIGLLDLLSTQPTFPADIRPITRWWRTRVTAMA